MEVCCFGYCLFTVDFHKWGLVQRFPLAYYYASSEILWEEISEQWCCLGSQKTENSDIATKNVRKNCDINRRTMHYLIHLHLSWLKLISFLFDYDLKYFFDEGLHSFDMKYFNIGNPKCTLVFSPCDRLLLDPLNDPLYSKPDVPQTSSLFLPPSIHPVLPSSPKYSAQGLCLSEAL